MTFIELIKFMRSIGISSLADIARELDVSPQSVSNWKARDQVPYKYIVYIQNKYNLDKDTAYSDVVDTHDRLDSSTSNNNRENLSIFNEDDELDLMELFKVLWDDRKRIIQITAFVTLLGILYALLETPLYKSTVTMYPSKQKSGGQLSQLQGMASSFGFDVGGMETSFHIPDIVESRRLKTELIYHEWSSRDYNKPVNLIHYWEIDDTTAISISLNPIVWIKSSIALIKSLFSSDIEKINYSLIWETDAMETLNDRISVSDDRTGLIQIDVLMEEPKMAADIANTMYPVIVDFTIEAHINQAKLNREFIEKRQEEVKIELANSEEQLKEFRQRNRNVTESPELQLELERLMREVQIQTEVYITLQQQYELARIEEVKETPSVVILDEGKPAVEKAKPKRKLIVIIAMLLGGIIAVTISLFNQRFKGRIVF